jgi:hypothetical protein
MVIEPNSSIGNKRIMKMEVKNPHILAISKEMNTKCPLFLRKE